MSDANSKQSKAEFCDKESAYLTVLHGEGADEDSIAAQGGWGRGVLSRRMSGPKRYR